MSSHHVVREQQEPALIITNTRNTSLEYIQPLLEWSPTILVLQDSINTVLNWGIKMDGIVLNDDCPLEIKEKLAGQQPIQYLTSIEKRDVLSVALDYLVKHKYEAVNIVGDQVLLFPLLRQYVNSLQLVIHNKVARSYHVASQYHKWVIAKTQFDIFPKNENVETTGLLKGEKLFVSKNDGRISIKNKTPFWVIEYL